MSTFRYHVSFGAFVAVLGTTIAYSYAYVTDMRLLGLLLAVTIIASFLPDLDSDTGLPYYFVFGLFTLLCGGAALYFILRTQTPSLRILIGIPLATSAFVWLVGGTLFKHFTHHRGMLHSIPAAAIAGLLMYVMVQSLGEADYTAALLAVGTGAGYVSHLVLDELHAGINLDGSIFRPKKSLGTALKFFSRSRMSNVLTYVILATLLMQVSA